MDHQEEEKPDLDYSIADVEKKVNELKNAVIKIGYEILALMDKGEEVPPELIAKQSAKEKQHTLFNKMLNQMKKNSNHKGTNPMDALLQGMSEVKCAMADIQQKIN